MVTREEMQELVDAHAELDEPTVMAIWIRRSDGDAWLVEEIPDLPADDQPERPIAFSPGRSFRHALNLIAGDWAELEAAVQRDRELARAIADGVVLLNDQRGRELQELARKAHGDARAV